MSALLGLTFLSRSFSLFYTSSVFYLSVSSAPTLASITKPPLLTADRIPALTEGHFQQKNSGLCLCMTQLCLGKHGASKRHVMPPSCVVLCFDTIRLGRRVSRNQK